MWSDFPISLRIFQFVVIHTVKGFGIVNTGEVDIFLELSGFFDDPMDIGNFMCIYIYIERERERDKVCIYICSE